MIAALLMRFWPYIAIAALSFGLYWQIGRTAQEKEAHRATIAINQSQAEAIERMQRESQLNEVLVVKTAGKVEVIRDEVEVIKYRNRETIRQAPAGDCRTVDHPDDVTSLLNSGS